MKVEVKYNRRKKYNFLSSTNSIFDFHQFYFFRYSGDIFGVGMKKVDNLLQYCRPTFFFC